MGQRLVLIIGKSLYSDTTPARLLIPDVDVGAFCKTWLDSEIGGSSGDGCQYPDRKKV